MEKLEREAVGDLIDRATVLHLACVDPGPYVTALSYVRIGDELFFRSYGGRRVSALRNDPRVAIEISEVDPESGAWASVVGSGQARFVETSVEAAAVQAALIAKYAEAYETLVSAPTGPPLGEAYVVAIALDHVEGRSSGSRWGNITRPGRM